jgi:hypothetical protein
MLKYFILIILIFGPKFGFFDTRLLLLPLLFFFDFQSNKIIVPILFLILYFFLKELSIYQNIDLTETLRLFKLLYVLLLIDIFSKLFNYTLKDLAIVLLIHVFFVIIMNEVEFIRDLIHNFYGFSKSYKQFRSTGLTLGYDISGFISIIAFIIWRCIKIKLWQKNIILLFIIVSVFLTSRVSLIVLFILLLYYSRNIILKNKLISGLLCLVVLLLIKDFIFEAYSQFLVIFGFISTDIESYGGYAIYSLESLYDQIFTWPTNLEGWLFGYKDEKVDSGYSMIIMKYGLVGLLIILTFYLKLSKIVKFNKHIFLTIILLMFVLNFKNEYFLTRGITEILLLLAFLNEKNENNFLTTL